MIANNDFNIISESQFEFYIFEVLLGRKDFVVGLTHLSVMQIVSASENTNISKASDARVEINQISRTVARTLYHAGWCCRKNYLLLHLKSLLSEESLYISSSVQCVTWTLLTLIKEY